MEQSLGIKRLFTALALQTGRLVDIPNFDLCMRVIEAFQSAKQLHSRVVTIREHLKQVIPDPAERSCYNFRRYSPLAVMNLFTFALGCWRHSSWQGWCRHPKLTCKHLPTILP